jgi:hypothetical protein
MTGGQIIMTINGRLEIQFIVGKILQKHNIDPTAESYYLKLRMPNYDDLVIEKEGKQVLVGITIIIRVAI